MIELVMEYSKKTLQQIWSNLIDSVPQNIKENE